MHDIFIRLILNSTEIDTKYLQALYRRIQSEV